MYPDNPLQHSVLPNWSYLYDHLVKMAVFWSYFWGKKMYFCEHKHAIYVLLGIFQTRDIRNEANATISRKGRGIFSNYFALLYLLISFLVTPKESHSIKLVVFFSLEWSYFHKSDRILVVFLTKNDRIFTKRESHQFTSECNSDNTEF